MNNQLEILSACIAAAGLVYTVYNYYGYRRRLYVSKREYTRHTKTLDELIARNDARRDLRTRRALSKTVIVNELLAETKRTLGAASDYLSRVIEYEVKATIYVMQDEEDAASITVLNEIDRISDAPRISEPALSSAIDFISIAWSLTNEDRLFDSETYLYMNSDRDLVLRSRRLKDRTSAGSMLLLPIVKHRNRDISTYLVIECSRKNVFTGLNVHFAKQLRHTLAGPVYEFVANWEGIGKTESVHLENIFLEGKGRSSSQR